MGLFELIAALSSQGGGTTPPPTGDIWATGTLYDAAGDSITHGTGADSYEQRWANQVAIFFGKTLVELAESGKSFQYVEPRPGGLQKTYFDWATMPDWTPERSAFSCAFSANDYVQGAIHGYVPWLYEQALSDFIDYAVATKGWPVERIILPGPYAFPVLSVVTHTPWILDLYDLANRRVAGNKGCVYIDVRAGCMARHGLQPGLHPDQNGHDDIALTYEEADYTPATPLIPSPTAHTFAFPFVATANINCADLGLSTDETSLLFERADHTNNYVPGRGSDPLTSLVLGTEYVIVPKFRCAIDRAVLTNIPAPKVETIDVATAAAIYCAASNRSNIESLLTTFFTVIRDRHLWDVFFSGYLLYDNFTDSAINLKTAASLATAYGTGETWTATGRVGSANSAFICGLDLADQNNVYTHFVKTNTDTTDSNYVIGTDRTGLITHDATYGTMWKHDGTGSLGSDVSGYDRNEEYPNVYCVQHNEDFVSDYKQGLAIMAWSGDYPALTGVGKMIVGNGENKTYGSTQEIAGAYNFGVMSDEDIYYVSLAIADLHAGIAAL